MNMTILKSKILELVGELSIDLWRKENGVYIWRCDTMFVRIENKDVTVASTDGLVLSSISVGEELNGLFMTILEPIKEFLG